MIRRASAGCVTLTAILLLIVLIGAARGAGLVADLSHRLIAITTAFSGTEVLLFGALDTPGADVAVIVRGPPSEVVVRRKSRIVGVWLNSSEMRFRSVPQYYATAASKPLDEIAAESELTRHQLGADRIRVEPTTRATEDPLTTAGFRQALIRNKERQGLWSESVGKLTFLGDRLFRTTFSFPANIVPGSYQVQVLELRDGLVVGAQSSALIISKVGLEADLFNFARRQPVVYGLVSIALAVLAGWSASAIFQRR
jgi:uncharacterized protein (TIGR02186 family)